MYILYYSKEYASLKSLTTYGVSRRLGDCVVWWGAAERPPGVDDPVDADPALLHDHQAQHHGQHAAQNTQQEEEYSLRELQVILRNYSRESINSDFF